MSGLASRRGFTLIEVLVVVFIVGVLATSAVPRYIRAGENGRADDAVAVVQMLAGTNRMYALDNGSYTTGRINDCPENGTCGSGSPAVCNLIYCNLLAGQDFSRKAYDFYAADGSNNRRDPCRLGPADHYVACAIRKGGASAPYSRWGYTVTRGGTIQPWPAIDGPPAPPS